MIWKGWRRELRRRFIVDKFVKMPRVIFTVNGAAMGSTKPFDYLPRRLLTKLQWVAIDKSKTKGATPPIAKPNCLSGHRKNETHKIVARQANTIEGGWTSYRRNPNPGRQPLSNHHRGCRHQVRKAIRRTQPIGGALFLLDKFVKIIQTLEINNHKRRLNMTTDMSTGQEPQRRGRRKTGAKPASPQDVAKIHLDDADGDKETAVEMLLESAERNRFLAEYLTRRGAETLVGEIVRSDRAKIFNDDPEADVTRRSYAAPYNQQAQPFRGKEAPMVSTAHKGRIKTTAKSLNLLAVSLPNGTTLANARHADLSDAAGRYGTQAKDMLHKSTFYSALGRELPKGKKVGDVMDNVALTNIWEQTKLAD